MKLLISLGILLSSSMLLAASACPADMKTVKNCVSTPAPGDNDVAASVFKAIAICNTGAKTVMAFTDPQGQVGQAEAQVISRAGGVSYAVTEDNVIFSLSMPTATSRPTKKAYFSVHYTDANLTSTSTYTCK